MAKQNDEDLDETPVLIPHPVGCRICFGQHGRLISPCKCSGSVQFVHADCLTYWLITRHPDFGKVHCEVCGYPYRVAPTFSYQCRCCVRSDLRSWLAGPLLVTAELTLVVAVYLMLKFYDESRGGLFTVALGFFCILVFLALLFFTVVAFKKLYFTRHLQSLAIANYASSTPDAFVSREEVESKACRL